MTDDVSVTDGLPPTAAIVRLVESAAGVRLDVDTEADAVETTDGIADASDDTSASAGDENRRSAESSAGEASTTLVGRGGGPAERLLSLLADADSVVGVVPRIESSLADQLTSTDTGGTTARIVLTGRAAARLTGPTRPAIRSAVADRGVDLYTHEGDSAIGILIVDDRAVAGLFDDRGLAAVLLTRDPSVRRWAAESCRRYLDAADPL
ncbi:MAG: hypothetical protein PPP55_07760 [Halorubrum sp.]